MIYGTLVVLLAGLGQTPDPKDAKVEAKADPQAIAFFESKIRPILVNECYQCHSADAVKAKKLKGGLFLDTRDAIRKGGDSGPAVVPGKSKEGHLLAALRYDGDVKMPPKKKLPDEVIADFAKWIEMGAPDPRDGGPSAAKKTIDIAAGREYWAFKPLTNPPLPTTKAAAKTPIDRFLLAKLEEKGLTPNGPASRETLVRRMYFDVWGLPPTPAQIDAFVNDKSPDAVEKLVDQLLAGQAYGERWARHWLDVVRYAESGGYEFDKDRPGAYHYRDWVIKSLNSDLPYDQFIKTQLAGDLLKPGDYDTAVATGFLVAGPYPGQTTSKTLELIRYNHLDDMLSTVGSGMLGLTLACARCHDHKYDPLPQQDYYSLIANLSRTDSVEPMLDPQPEIYRKAKAEFDTAHAPLVAAREKYETDELPARAAAWKAKAAPPAVWQILDLVEAKGKTPFQKLPDGSAKATGKLEKFDTLTLVGQTHEKGVVALRLEALADASLPKSGPGVDGDGSITVTEISVLATPIGGKGKPAPVKLKAIQATSEAKDHAIALAVDGDAKTGWMIDPGQHGKNHAAVFETAAPIDGGVQLTVTIKFDGKNHAIGRPRLAISTTAKPAHDAPAELQNGRETLIALGDGGVVTKENRAAVARWFRPLDPGLDAVAKAVEDRLKAAPQPKLTQTFVAQGNRGGDVFFLIRGEVERKGPKATPGYLQVLLRDDPKATAKVEPKVDPRIALGDWLVDKNGAGPLLARVIVNRLWQHHFGRGIVATPNDFGLQGDPPSHPELLEFLANDLATNGWSLKRIHKAILLTDAYQRSGEVRPDAMKADPTNRLLWRRPAQRMEAEIIRDNLLAVGGSLNPTPYGPATPDVNSPRRSIYLTVKRSQPVPFLAMLDTPETIQSIGERSLTTVPTQSLAFMNSPLVRAQADKLAKLLMSQAKENLGDAIETAYRTALGRRPSAVERARMTAFIEQQTATYGPNGREPALADFCQVLLCLNEFVYVD